jgi:hypothetical protein
MLAEHCLLTVLGLSVILSDVSASPFTPVITNVDECTRGTPVILMGTHAVLRKEEEQMVSAATESANSDLSDIEVMTDQATLADLSNLFRDQGSMMVCHRCDDVSAIIAGILVVKETEEAWVLCGPCLREIPLHGPLAS